MQANAAAKQALRQAAASGNSANAQSRLRRIFDTATRYETNIRKSNPTVFNDPSRSMATAGMYPRNVYAPNIGAKGGSKG